MLTIKNARRDVGTTIGAYILSSVGLSSPKAGGDGECYSFYWDCNDKPIRFKYLLDRDPVYIKSSIYRLYKLRLYDSTKKVQGTNRDGFVFETKISETWLHNRTDFYRIMHNAIEQSM